MPSPSAHDGHARRIATVCRLGLAEAAALTLADGPFPGGRSYRRVAIAPRTFLHAPSPAHLAPGLALHAVSRLARLNPVNLFGEGA
ncbi:hypothetical protein [Streptomyces sp. NRRL S-1824]|uniref:hypothetical protein n=1 Tax=Streptomyces sp. NRRL S-1824 TaxID=1463889 RepID=UPI000AB8ACAF|nr:hypothetical protein [Streptomyces sp. NRRL S-1824]